jgi:hypothetical protein
MQRHAGRHMTHLPSTTKITDWIHASIVAGYEQYHRPVRRDDLIALDILRGRQAIPPARRPRKPTLASLLKQAANVGKSVKGVEVYSDRTVLQFGEPEPVQPENPWPLDEFRPKETKQ